MKKQQRNSIIFIVIFLIIILSFFFVKIFEKEKENYKLYNDFTRANQVMTLTLNKNFSIQFLQIRLVQAANYDIKETEGSLIFDFSQYELIPILNYLNKTSEDQELINSFSRFTDFLANYLGANIGSRENVLMKMNGNDYFMFENDIYTYQVSKKIITKETFNKLYNDYLKTQNLNSLEENFIKKLMKKTEIKNNETISSIKSKVANRYQDFYDKYCDSIIEVLAEDLNTFTDYLNTYLKIDYEGNTPIEILKTIPTETISLFYQFAELERIYNPASKYYTHSYQLDIQNVWTQLKNVSYPKLYM